MRVIQRPLQILAFTLFFFSAASYAEMSASVSYGAFCGAYPFYFNTTVTITCSISGNNLSCSQTASGMCSSSYNASTSITHQNTLANIWFTSSVVSTPYGDDLRQLCANDTAGTAGLCWDLRENSSSISLSTDYDNDGVTSYYDNCRANSNSTQADFDGDGQGDTCDNDIDNDGVANYYDAFDFDPTETVDTDADGIGNNTDTDDDGDSILDASDNCPLNTNASQVNFDDDTLGDACDDDIDNDDVPNYSDAFDFDPTETIDTDADGIGNNTDTDDDGDGVLDVSDNCPLNANASQANVDGDSQGDVCDSDDDNDGVSDSSDKFPLNPAASSDSDFDGFPGSWNAACDATCQANSGLILDNCPSINNPTQTNFDGDAQGDVCDSDDDNDGVLDSSDAFDLDPTETVDTDNDGIGDNADTDDDNDGVPDVADNCPFNGNASQADSDGDGKGDACADVIIAAGEGHTCTVTTSGGVKCWGSNQSGQLGDGTTTNRSTPVDVSGLTSGISAIAAGQTHTCALTTAGAVKCWGYNAYGQLGDGTSTNRYTPVDVSGLSSGVIAITAGAKHTCALTTAGAVKCWGDNGVSQLGDVPAVSHYAPVNVSGLSNGVIAITAGSSHSCALTTTGGVKCWGYNSMGQLGNGTTTITNTLVSVSGLASGVIALSAGYQHNCAVLANGAVKCWGYNALGQLGDGSTTNRYTPVAVSGLTNGVIAVAAGQYRTCALMTTGGVKCWGNNYGGQLGDGTTTNSSTPVNVSLVGSSVSALAVGYNHSCILTNTGAIMCWGYNNAGQLGDGTTTNRYTPVYVSGMSDDLDNDTILNSADNCPSIANADQLNTDGDAQGDACDTDDDNDTMPDSWENSYNLDPFLNDTLADADNDGINNISEYRNGSNPTVVDLPARKQDLDTDADSDLVFHDGSGTVSTWILENAAVQSINTNIGSITPHALKAVCDVDHDLDTDLVFQNAATGGVILWVMQNGIKQSETWLGSLSGYTLSACGDTNKDGNSDLIFADTNGNFTVMTLNSNHTVLATTWLGQFSGWTYAALSDVDADGDKDIIMQTASGSIGIIALENGNKVSASWLGQWNGGWSVVGSGDADNDNDDDLFISTAAGDIGIVKLQAGSNVGSDWFGNWPNTSVKAIGDINNDGDADVIFQSTAYDLNVVDVQDAQKAGARWLGQLSGYDIKGTEDMDGDGDDDLVLQDGTGNVAAVVMEAGDKQSLPWLGSNTGQVKVFP